MFPRAAEVFFSTDSGLLECLHTYSKKSATTPGVEVGKLMCLDAQNSAECCNCLLYVDKVELAQQRGTRFAA